MCAYFACHKLRNVTSVINIPAIEKWSFQSTHIFGNDLRLWDEELNPVKPVKDANSSNSNGNLLAGNFPESKINKCVYGLMQSTFSIAKWEDAGHSKITDAILIYLFFYMSFDTSCSL